MSAPAIAPTPVFPFTQFDEVPNVAHIFNPDETPLVSYCGVELDPNEHICDETCGCLVCPVCDAIEHLLHREVG